MKAFLIILKNVCLFIILSLLFASLIILITLIKPNLIEQGPVLYIPEYLIGVIIGIYIITKMTFELIQYKAFLTN